MEILSISIDDETLKQLNGVQKRLGFKSRSKMLRNAISSMIKDYESLDLLKGVVEVVFVITYGDTEKTKVSDILHRFEDAIKTELHQHNLRTCIDIINVNADANKIREIFGMLKRSKSVYSVTYVLVKNKVESKK